MLHTNIPNISLIRKTRKATVETTVNGERFTGLNFRVFCGFQEHRESFPMNIYKLCIMALLKYCKHKAPRKFSREKLHWVESMKV